MAVCLFACQLSTNDMILSYGTIINENEKKARINEMEITGKQTNDNERRGNKKIQHTNDIQESKSKRQPNLDKRNDLPNSNIKNLETLS